MRLAKDIALLVLLLAASGALAYTAWDLHQTQVAARQTSADLDVVLKRFNSPTGPITEVDKLLLALKSTTVHADMVIAHEDKQLSRYDGYVGQMAADIHGLSDGAGRSFAAVTETAHGATAVLGTANTTIQAAQPLLGQLTLTAQASTQTINALNGRLRDPKIDDLMEHIRSMSDSGDKMLADAQWKESQLLHPPKRKLGFWAGTWAGFEYVRTQVLPKVTLF